MNCIFYGVYVRQSKGIGKEFSHFVMGNAVRLFRPTATFCPFLFNYGSGNHNTRIQHHQQTTSQRKRDFSALKNIPSTDCWLTKDFHAISKLHKQFYFRSLFPLPRSSIERRYIRPFAPPQSLTVIITTFALICPSRSREQIRLSSAGQQVGQPLFK